MNEIIVNCGDTSAHPDAERAYRAIRVEQGDTAPAGCGKPVGLIHLYRCTDCARWMHHSCLVRHFVDHGDEARARVARLEAAMSERYDTMLDYAKASTGHEINAMQAEYKLEESAAENAALRERIERLAALEWGDTGDDCRFCYSDPDDGHASNCSMALALAATPQATP